MLSLSGLKVTVSTKEAHQEMRDLQAQMLRLQRTTNRMARESVIAFTEMRNAIDLADRGMFGLISRMNAAQLNATNLARKMTSLSTASSSMTGFNAQSMAASATFAGMNATMSSNFAPSPVPMPVITSFSGLGGAAGNAGANINYVSQQLRQVPQAAAPATNSMMALTRQFVGFYLAYQGVKETVGAFAGFEKEMDAVQALTAASAQEMALLEAKAREVGPGIYYNATEAAQGMNELAAAGLKVNEIFDAMSGVMDFAAAGPITVAEAADTGVKTLAQFNLQASEMSRVADVISKASDISRAKIGMLGDSLKYVGANANVLGVSLEETVAMLAVLTQSGLDASMAGTGLRTTLDALLDPSKEAQKMLQAYGLTVDDLNVKTHGLLKVMETLQSLPVTEFGKLFDTRGLTSALIATRDLETFKSFNAQIKEAKGHAQQMAAVRMDNLLGDWKVFKNLLHEVALDLGREGGIAEALRGIVQLSSDVLKWLDENINAVFYTFRATWTEIANVADNTFTFILTTALEAGRIITGIFLGLKGTVQTVFAFIDGIVAQSMRFIVEGFKKVVTMADNYLGGLDLLAKMFPDAAKLIPFADKLLPKLSEAQQVTAKWKADLTSMSDSLNVNPFDAAFKAMQKITAEMDEAKQRADALREALMSGNVERVAARTRSLAKYFQELFTPTPFQSVGASNGLGNSNPFGNAREEQQPLFDRFHTAGMSVDQLNERIESLKETLNSDEWISTATVEDFQEKNEELGAMSDALRRRFESNSVRWNQSLRQGMKETVESWGTLSQRMASVGSGIAETFDRNFTDAFSNMILGTESVAEAFQNMSNAIISDLVRIMVQQLIVRQVLQAFGLFGGISTGTPDTASIFNSTGSGMVAHSGGIAGYPSRTRMVTPRDMLGAQRKHGGGMAGDETTVIARRNEGIFTEKQMEAMGKGGNQTTIINAMDPASFADAVESQPQAVLNILSKYSRQVRQIVAPNGR